MEEEDISDEEGAQSNVGLSCRCTTKKGKKCDSGAPWVLTGRDTVVGVTCN